MASAAQAWLLKRSVWQFRIAELLAYTAIVGLLIGPVWSYIDWCANLRQRQQQWHFPTEFTATSAISDLGGSLARPGSDLYYQRIRDFETWQQEVTALQEFEKTHRVHLWIGSWFDWV